MKTSSNLTPEQALQFALACTDLENDEFCCLSSRYSRGLYSFVLCTLCLRYEFYVDASNGEVLGINTEPFSSMEAMNILETKILLFHGTKKFDKRNSGFL